MRYTPFLVASAFAGTWAQANDDAYSPKFRRSHAYLPSNNIRVRHIQSSARSLNVSPREVGKNAQSSATPTTVAVPGSQPTQSAVASIPASLTTSSSAPAATSDGDGSNMTGVAIALGSTFGGILLLYLMFGTSCASRPRVKRDATCPLPLRKKLTNANAVEEIQNVLPEKSEQEIKEAIETINSRVAETRSPAQLKEIADALKQENLQSLMDETADEGALQLVRSLAAEVRPIVVTSLSLNNGLPENEIILGDTDAVQLKTETGPVQLNAEEGEESLAKDAEDLERETAEGAEELITDIKGSLIDAFGNVGRPWR